MTKQALFKANGKTKLSWKELESVLLDIEITLNDRPLGCIEDGIHKPNLMILGQPNFELKFDANNTDDCDLKNRGKYIRSCKYRVWSRWTKEYLRGLREQHRLVQGTETKGRRCCDYTRHTRKTEHTGKLGLSISFY